MENTEKKSIWSKFYPRRATSERLNENGHETLSDKPMAMPVGMKRPETLAEQVARLVRNENFKQAVANAGAETFDEAEDFDVGDDFDPFSPYETVFDPILGREVSPADFLAKQDDYRKAYQKAHERLADEEFPVPRTTPTAPAAKRPQKAGVAKGASSAAESDDE